MKRGRDVKSLVLHVGGLHNGKVRPGLDSYGTPAIKSKIGWRWRGNNKTVMKGALFQNLAKLPT